MDWELHRCCMFDAAAACHEGESKIQCCGNIMSYDSHQVPSICQVCSSYNERWMWFSLVGFEVGWISHSITNHHITLLKLPNINTTLLHYEINVCGMHYTCPFQQSSLPLWPGHDLLLAFFTSSNLLSTFATPAIAKWYPESWTALKAWRKLMPGNENNLELVFLLDVLLRLDAFCLLFPYRVVVHALAGQLGWKQMHLCLSRVHHIRCIDMYIEPRHHACVSMCINVLPPYLD